MVIYQKAKFQEGFELKSAFYSLLYGICRNLWLKQLRKKDRQQVTIKEEMVFSDDQDIEADILQNAKASLYREKFALLGEDCQKVLNMNLEEKSMREIAEEMGYASPEYARKKKFTCKERLINMIRSDTTFKELAGHDTESVDL